MPTPPDATQTDRDADDTAIRYRCKTCAKQHEIAQSTAFRGLVQDACARIGDSTAAIYRDFGIGAPGGRWDLDPGTGEFVFSFANGRRCVSQCQVVSSWRSETQSWFWSWAHPEDWLAPPLRQAGNHALDRGLEEGWDALTTDLLLVCEAEAWHLTMLTAHLSGLPMVYRARTNEINHRYFALTRPVWMH